MTIRARRYPIIPERAKTGGGQAPGHSRRSFFRFGAAAMAGVTVGQFATHSVLADGEPAPTTGEEALARLLEGNQRFVAGQSQHPDQSLDRRAAAAAGQQPFAFVLGCYDSRVSHELVFDQGLGDIFSSRTAGNLLDDAVLGGIEFGVEEFQVPLVVIMGHQRCGAVSATLSAVTVGGEAPGSIGSVIEAIRPAVEETQGDSGDPLDNAVRANVRLGVQRVLASPVITHEIDAHGVMVVGAYYSLDTGQVEIISGP